MMVVLQCPVCNSSFQVHANQAGQQVGCPSCQQTVSVPESIAPTTVEEPEVFACPFCEGKFGVAPEMRGSEVQCPHCHKHVAIQTPNVPTGPLPTSGEEELFAPGYQAAKGDQPNPINIRTGKKGRKKKKIQIPPPIDEVKPPSASPAATTPNQTPVNETKDSRFRKIKEPAKPAVPPPPSSKKPSPSESAPTKPTQPSRPNRPPPSSKKNADRDKSKTRFKTSEENLKPKKSTSGKKKAPPHTKVPPKVDATLSANISNKIDSPQPSSLAKDHDQRKGPSESAPPNSAVEKPRDISLASIAKATTDPIDAMLPPKFTAIDPDEIRMQSASGSKDEHKVILPDGDGGYKRVDSRVVHVQREGEKIQLYASSKDQKERRRWIQNVLAIIFGIIILALAFAILQSR